MGLGGNLIWTGVLSALSEKEEAPIYVCHKPKLSDLLCGVLHNRNVTLADDQIFKGLNFLRFTPLKNKSVLAKGLDFAFDVVLRITKLGNYYECLIFDRAEKRAHAGSDHLVHVDMLIHSYAETQTSDRLIWKNGGHAMSIIAKKFGVEIQEPLSVLNFGADEEAGIDALLASMNLTRRRFIVVEPDTNREWFGELRAWPFERWQTVVDTLRKQLPGVQVVQLGLANSPILEGVLSLCGQTNFRQAALVQRSSALFIGTEGGLMHAAAAVGTPSVILWGGVTVPDFAGYPQHHDIICKNVSCAPCGHLGWCDNGHICMNEISAEEVIAEILSVYDYNARARDHGCVV